MSLQTGDLETGYVFDWNFGVYTDAINDYDEQFLRSFGYAATATVLALRHRVPARVLHRVQGAAAGKQLPAAADHPAVLHELPRADGGVADDPLRQRLVVVDALQDVGLLADDGRLLATRTAVIAGITYNFLPFMALPLYVSLEKIDRRLIEAATDLYASRATGVPQGHAAARAAGHLRRLAADVHPRRRRLHQRRSCSARRAST